MKKLIETLKQNIAKREVIECTKLEYFPYVRQELWILAETCINNDQPMFCLITLDEIKRLDTKYSGADHVAPSR